MANLTTSTDAALASQVAQAQATINDPNASNAAIAQARSELRAAAEEIERRNKTDLGTVAVLALVALSVIWWVGRE